MLKIFLPVSCFIIFFGTTFSAQEDNSNHVFYEKSYKDPALEEMKKAREEVDKKNSEETEKIKKKQEKDKKDEEDKEMTLRSDTTGIFSPKSPEDFKSVFYFPPIRQYATGTCWSFSGTSFFETEIYRLTKKKIKLSEMWTPYFEYLEKAGRYVKERGDSVVGGGSEFNAVMRIWEKYGVVPAEAFSGLKDKSQRHDHMLLEGEITKYLDFIKANNFWDEEEAIKHITLILDKYLGAPPKTFKYNGKEMTPQEFLKNETGLTMADYVDVMSTSYYPFYTYQEYKFPDNWWHNKDYINLPLDVWYEIILKSIKAGYSMAIGGDVSEPGKLGMKNIAFIPTFDIPESYINQDSREYRIENKSTGDDHGVHLVGYTNVLGKDWFLVKDSSSSAQRGTFKGYVFFREDFIKLKMLSYTVHKDMLKDILPKIKK